MKVVTVVIPEYPSVCQVNDASCRRSNKERFVFRQVNGKYKFDTFPSGHGYIILLRCMTAA